MRTHIVIFWTAAAFLACSAPPNWVRAQAPQSPTPPSREGVVTVDTVARGLEHPWGLAFLPDGRMLVTERPGRLRLVDRQGRLSEPLAGVPPVLGTSQGGLLDVVLDPRFADNRLVYFSYAEPGEKGTAGTAVARGRLADNRLEDVQVVYRQQPKVKGPIHFGSRLVFARDGTLFVTQGDRYDYREQAQDLSSGIGKIVRIHPDGAVPRDNPFVGRDSARPEIWSYGHRNVQAAALHPETGQLWTVEHGARGGDELNHPEAGKNYGWPVITYGVDYDGTKIGEGTAKAGMEQPVYYWDPVIAPSGMTFYTGDVFPAWKGSVLIGSLKPGLLVRLTLKDGTVAQEERYLAQLRERIRDVRQGPDGLLYLLTDSDDGRILRISPAKS
ncbi:PQQ-dependent sugar dehydrogenase [Nitrospira moscoviensis]|uniref:Soluble aldose sugar dehydrogenase YliI n=1 Tax=Nitrospira moscoviensis TaxID=42253 RepID=A0A0K2G8A6_NITMO|nr:PQQ-dependent sugar dehydrogenase [Nitrospira moscoviensis]ALA57206.1 Soluble aldose sugar dehydrogenase YliI [Nitrospira moscoviensis]